MTYFDSHSHYYDERFSEEAAGGAEAILDTLFGEGTLGFVVNVGTNPDTCRQAIAQAKKHEKMYTALGIHPGDCQHLTVTPEEAVAEIERLILGAENKCVALGEIGLDYHYPDTQRELQLKYFRMQMSLAEKLSLPVVIHDRDAHGDVMEVIREFPRVRGVLHSFSGSAEMAEELIEKGYYISFSGTLTFTNAKRPKEVAARIPMDKILIETDCPYLAPHPKRGTLNHSGNLVYTNAALAEIKGISEQTCAEVTLENAKRFFGI
jgi:TatD DNase family protein